MTKQVSRKDVARTSRIEITEALIESCDFTRVLELGAGDLSFDHLCKNRQGTAWTKADIAPPCDTLIDLNRQDLRFPFSDSEFDLIIATEVLEHLLWPQSVLKECHRVLMGSGALILSVPNVNSLSYRLAWLMGRIPSCAASANLPLELGSTAYENEKGELFGGHVIDFNVNRTERLLKLTGFMPEVMRGCGIYWHRQIVPPRLCPVRLSSNIIVKALPTQGTGRAFLNSEER